MKLIVSEGKKLCELQGLFGEKYPFLKLEVYRLQDNDLQTKKILSPETILKYTPGHSDGFSIEDTMTVSELGDLFLRYFGLRIIVFRKAGIMWLETTLTANWTLRKQNDHGREITNPEYKKAGGA